MDKRPKVGVGIYIVKDGKVLIGRRKGGLGPDTWCAPGGKLEMYEDPSEAAAREALEETGVEVEDVRFIGFTNDIDEETEHHYVTLQFGARWKAGEPSLMEPEKFHDEWHWAEWSSLPEPQFIGLRKFIEKGYNPLNS